MDFVKVGRCHSTEKPRSGLHSAVVQSVCHFHALGFPDAKRSGILDITEFHGKPLHYYLLNFGPEYSAVHGSYETAPHVGLLHFATENDSAEDVHPSSSIF
ncbi:unnamed protein product [Acanthocheilonema viteae]|uniref:Uncharacterized protein n=1 Tax=Acanthocheilonema viteae TaxID=6277 RepID=A0A498S5A2_ACAVI|nr:unnamed protein product [Acanthocheilonema viteae]